MKELKRLAYRILTLLDLMENPKNQPMVNQIKGLIYEILDIISKIE